MRAELSGSSIARSIHEALAGVVAADRAAVILTRALAGAGVREVPEDTVTLRLVVRGVVAGVEDMVGAEAAQLVEGELDALLRVIARIEALAEGGQARSGSLPREVHRASTARTVAPPLVLVVTAEPELASRLRQRIDPSTRVEVATSMDGLRFQILRARPVRPVVVVDARTTALSESTIGSPPPRAQGATALVVWGEAGAEAWAWVEPDRVVRCSAEVELVDLACLLRTSLAKVA